MPSSGILPGMLLENIATRACLFFFSAFALAFIFSKAQWITLPLVSTMLTKEDDFGIPWLAVMAPHC